MQNANACEDHTNLNNINIKIFLFSRVNPWMYVFITIYLYVFTMQAN